MADVFASYDVYVGETRSNVRLSLLKPELSSIPMTEFEKGRGWCGAVPNTVWLVQSLLGSSVV